MGCTRIALTISEWPIKDSDEPRVKGHLGKKFVLLTEVKIEGCSGG